MRDQSDHKVYNRCNYGAWSERPQGIQPMQLWRVVEVAWRVASAA